MTWADDELVTISALQHFVYCPRQCALIHVEQTSDENVFTLRGQRIHENVDVPREMLREGVQIETTLPLWSERLGLCCSVPSYDGRSIAWFTEFGR